MEFYLVRHGETEWNKAGRFQGQLDSDLTDLGIEQAKQLREDIKNHEFNKIYSSSSGRAYNTAKILTDEEVIKIDDLREINLGRWQGEKIEEIKEIDKELFHNYANKPSLFDHNKIDGEAIEEVRERAFNVLINLIDENKKGKFLLVTHGFTLKMLLSKIDNMPLDNLKDYPVPKNCEMIKIIYEDNMLKIIR